MQTCRALVVDDNVPSAMTLMWMAEAEGCEAQMCHDGASALALCETFRPDVIFLDIGMPGMSGLEVCTRLRKDHRYDRIKIIAQTGWGDAEMRQRTQEAGFTEHLLKPVSPTRFHDILSEMRNAPEAA